jgi:predicted  nucleic acid-binding Zn-ribbon protein
MSITVARQRIAELRARLEDLREEYAHADDDDRWLELVNEARRVRDEIDDALDHIDEENDRLIHERD